VDLPFGHNWQLSMLLPAEVLENVPARQFMQMLAEVAPTAVEYVL